jgi:hypothetical protein
MRSYSRVCFRQCTDAAVSQASLSSSNPFSAISPKPKHHQPNANVLASSPNTFSSFLNVKPEQQRSDEEWTVEELEDDDEDERESAQTEVTKGPLVVYSRTELLKLAKKDSAPQTMPTLDSWFGYVYIPVLRLTDHQPMVTQQDSSYTELRC